MTTDSSESTCGEVAESKGSREKGRNRKEEGVGGTSRDRDGKGR